MSTCGQCKAEAVPHTEFCIECGHDGITEKPKGRRLDISDVDPPDREKLVRLLVSLTEQSDETVTFLIDRKRFELDVEATAARAKLLEEMLAAAGMRFRSSEQVFSDSTSSVRWAHSREVVIKLAVTVVMGGTALVLGVPLVPAAALLTSLIMAGRSFQIVPHRLAVRPAVTDQMLGIESAILAEAHAARKGMSDPLVLRRLRTCVDHFAETAWQLREGGAHIAQPEFGRMDAQLHQLLRQTIKLAVSADRLRARAENAAQERPSQADARTEIDTRLEEIERALAKIRTDVRDLQGAEAGGQALSHSRRVLADLRIGIDTALEMAELGSPKRRRSAPN